MTVPHYNRVGSILYLKKQKATRCNSGDQILPYMLRLIFGKKKFMDRLYVYIYIFFFELNDNVPIPGQFISI
jgi:hypothetical protein